jgi:hypothetical protein
VFFGRPGGKQLSDGKLYLAAGIKVGFQSFVEPLSFDWNALKGFSHIVH